KVSPGISPQVQDQAGRILVLGQHLAQLVCRLIVKNRQPEVEISGGQDLGLNRWTASNQPPRQDRIEMGAIRPNQPKANRRVWLAGKQPGIAQKRGGSS